MSFRDFHGQKVNEEEKQATQPDRLENIDKELLFEIIEATFKTNKNGNEMLILNLWVVNDCEEIGLKHKEIITYRPPTEDKKGNKFFVKKFLTSIGMYDKDSNGDIVFSINGPGQFTGKRFWGLTKTHWSGIGIEIDAMTYRPEIQ